MDLIFAPFRPLKFISGLAILTQYFALFQTAHAEPSSQISYHGKAFDTERQAAAYTEERSEKYEGIKLAATETKFMSPQGQPIGNLKLDFARFPFKPDYEYQDFRNGYREGAKVKGNRIHAFFRDSDRASLKEKTLDVPEPCIINGGVGEFVKEHWAEIVAGTPVPFNMVIPARLDYYKFVAYVDSKYQVPEAETGHKVCKPVVIEPKNSLLAMLLPVIVMHFEPNTKKMLRYQGIVNIADAKGRSLRVRVDYPELMR